MPKEHRDYPFLLHFYQELAEGYMKLQGKSGICRGSSYSFTTEYYKEELLWIINDPHGIGIVLLAEITKKNVKNANPWYNTLIKNAIIYKKAKIKNATETEAACSDEKFMTGCWNGK